jgi:chromosome segregation ATPase
LREQLRQRDRRIADLERQVDGKDPFNRSLNSSSGSLGSIRSEEKASGDAIMQRLQTQLDEAHEELKSKDELLQTQSASLQLQTHRVAELEYELKKISEDTLQELKDEVQKLQDDKKSLEDQIQAERKESDERMKKKDEAVIFFQNELTKMKMNPGGNDPQRALLESSVHSRRNLDDSMHSTASATVHRAFGGLGALFGKEKVESDALSIVTPRMED